MERTTSRRLGPLAGLLFLGMGSLGLVACKSGHHAVNARPPAAPEKSSSVTHGGKPLPLPAAAAPRKSEPAPVAAEAEPGETAVEEPGARELQPTDELNGDAIVEAPAEAAPEPQTLLHESMEAYESADDLWKTGSIEDAIAALDHAYERMLQVEPPAGDPLLAQEKESLRNLISRRVVEIYASRKASVGDTGASIPKVMNDDVLREIQSFQGRERDFFLEAYQRSGIYRPHIVAELAKAGMPEQLSWLPLVESGFKDRALSSARALGLWQFIPSTGYRYGLDRSDWIDERMDPEKSTQGAIAYLTALHDLFGDWLTALAAYNCGEHNVLRAIDNQKVSYFDQFWDLYQRLPRETRRYVPRFLATIAILEDPAKYGFQLPPLFPPLDYEAVEVARAAPLAALDKALGIESGTLARLNPELRRNASPHSAYTLKVPRGAGTMVLASIDSLPKYTPPAVEASGGVHRVRSGDTLSGIASRYHTSIQGIMTLNRLRSADRLSLGQKLLIPGGRTRASSGSGSSSGGGARLVGESGGTYVVRRGDTLGSIAESQGVPLSQLLAANRLGGRSTIYPGQRLTIPGRATGG